MAIHFNKVHHMNSRRIKDREKRTYYPDQYWLVISRWRLRDYLVWRLYHFYDMRIPSKVPYWSRFERFLRNRFGASINFGVFEDEDDPRWYDRILTWSFNQDIRCYELSQKDEYLAKVEVDFDTYQISQGR